MTFNKLLLKTAFSCMACDGKIDKKEIDLIKSLHHEKDFFGDIDLNNELDFLLQEINKDSELFLRNYFKELSSTFLSEQEELKLIKIAIETIKADNNIEYSEIKFFKLIRSKLKISNEPILEIHPEFEEYLEQDIMKENSLNNLLEEYLSIQKLPEFEQNSILNEK
jgi:uncharacterized tellurite resistance protein B-like protein